MGDSKEAVTIDTTRTVEILRSLGFLLNLPKSRLMPKTSFTWLGIHWDTDAGVWGLPREKATVLSKDVHTLLTNHTASRRSWERLVGRMAFTCQVNPTLRCFFAPVARSQLLGSPRSRDRACPIPDRLRSALVPWAAANVLTTLTSFTPSPPTMSLWTDASLTGWGALSSTGATCSGRWTQVEQALHITLLEVRAVTRSIQFLDLRSQTITLFIDNETAKHAIKKAGSKSRSLHHEVATLLDACEAQSTRLLPTRISSRLNVVADSLSRDLDSASEWTLPTDLFDRILHWHGDLQVDLLATPLNARLDTFVCPFPHPLAAGVDVLSVRWDT